MKCRRGTVLLDLIVGNAVGITVFLLIFTIIGGTSLSLRNAFGELEEKTNFLKFHRYVIDDLSLRYNSAIISHPQSFTINERSYSIQNGKLVRTHQGRVTSFGRGVLTQNITIINAENHLAVTFTKENRAKVLRLGRAVIGQ